MDTFEIAIEAEYSDTMVSKVTKILEEKLPNFTRNKVLIIKLIEVE